jgi:pyridoxamine 5'-phosphate oxidase
MMKEKDLRTVRVDYNQFKLDDESILENPFDLFAQWLEEAAEHIDKDYNAMVVSSVGQDGPSSRIVLLRKCSDEGFMFYTNRASRKAMDFRFDNRVALNFFWSALERQVRVQGTVIATSEEESDDYFNTRPRGSKLSAWASEQSQEIVSRSALERNYQEMESRFNGQDVPRPPFWGGYLVVPNAIEFWQGRNSRLHDRVLFKLNGDGWNHVRLQP